ncbi:ABC transporter substrate-binding protein [Agromyces subbeticus]|uniref:ABC transporter substrate-binding protein n=1 Tax=Agromyces subbeticus TaxID=293890 RepID=UPI00146B3190|nr:ABC transporter substrate-binding protein [Agromyces subbeticus]
MARSFYLHRSIGVTAALAVALSLAACAGSGASGAGSTDSSADSIKLVSPGALTICTGDSPPNIFYDENNELTGVEIDIAGALATELDLELKLSEYAFAGLIPALQAQQCDVIMGSLYIKPEREEIANFVPYLYSGTAVGVAKANPKNVSGFDESLCGTKVVAITGATGAVEAENRSKECTDSGEAPIEITLVDEGTNAIQQVLAGQADAFIDTSEIVDFYHRESDGDFEMTGEPFGKIEIGAATLKNNAALNEALDEAFQTVLDDGRYHEILEQWGVQSADIAAGA